MTDWVPVASVADIPPERVAVYTVGDHEVAVCNVSGAATGNIANTATISSAVSDPSAANNTATDTDAVTPSDPLPLVITSGVIVVAPLIAFLVSSRHAARAGR